MSICLHRSPPMVLQNRPEKQNKNYMKILLIYCFSVKCYQTRNRDWHNGWTPKVISTRDLILFFFIFFLFYVTRTCWQIDIAVVQGRTYRWCGIELCWLDLRDMHPFCPVRVRRRTFHRAVLKWCLWVRARRSKLDCWWSVRRLFEASWSPFFLYNKHRNMIITREIK
jgi:hypothetical protein